MGRTKKGRGKNKRGGSKKSQPPSRDHGCEESGDDGKFVPADVNTPPAWGIGKRVELIGIEKEGFGCNIGTVTGHWMRAPDWPENLVAPYQVRLDDGRSVLVRVDSEACIRESDVPPLKVAYRMGSRVECKLGENGEWFAGTVLQTHRDWIEKDSCVYYIHFDYGSSRPFWGPQECIRASSTASSKKKASEGGLRFKVGDRVSCRCGRPTEDDRIDGTVIKLWYTQKSTFADDYVVPYQIQLDTGDQIWAPLDDDACIMRATSAPPDCWICFENELSGSNLIVRECACRGGSNGFVHINCLVKLAKAKVEDRDPKVDGVDPFYQCITCMQPFDERSHCSSALAKAFYETYKRRPIYDLWNKVATTKYASVLAHKGKFHEALHLLNERISQLRLEIDRGSRMNEDVTDWESDLANFLLDLASVYDEMNSLPEMKNALDESLSIMDVMGGFGPRNKKGGMQLMAKYAYESGDKNAAEALEHLDMAITLVKESGGGSDTGMLFSQGNLNLECGNKELGLEQLSRAVEELSTAYGKNHSQVLTANKYILSIAQGRMDKMPSDGLKVIL